jgi:hypothetical protein
MICSAFRLLIPLGTRTPGEKGLEKTKCALAIISMLRSGSARGVNIRAGTICYSDIPTATLGRN